jgi:hypothetical protein
LRSIDRVQKTSQVSSDDGDFDRKAAFGSRRAVTGAHGAQTFTTDAVMERHGIPGMAINPRPEFIRLPKSGSPCPFTGLSRTGLNALILPTPANGFKPPVRSISLRQRGQARGTRLIVFDSLIEYLHRLETSPTTPVSTGPSII